jgi:5-methylcytosine-specific restriction enzyme A
MFIQGKIYKRSIVHGKYGGQTQGGISTPANSPLILIFSGEEGEQFGYRDGWNNSVFLYTGEGQIGDMEFVRGNKAIINHSMDGKDLHLFLSTSQSGMVRYEGQMICVGFRETSGPDRENTPRKIIVFELEPISHYTLPDYEEEFAEEDVWRLSLEENRKLALLAAEENPRTLQRSVSMRKRSERIRIYVLRRARGVCEYCGKEAPFTTDKGRLYLEPHHIRRLSDGGPDNPKFMAAVCPNCHRRAHYSKEREEVNMQLQAKVFEIERKIELS